MSRVKDVVAILEENFPLHNQVLYDNCGLIVGSEDMIVSGLLLTMDVVESVVDEAIERGYNMILSHHPFVFSGIKQFSGDSTTNRILTKAIKHDIAIYASHTSADSVLCGVSGAMARLIGLEDISILKPHDRATMDVGFGVVGNMVEEISRDEMLKMLALKFNQPAIRYTLGGRTSIKRVALCGGSGADLIGDAIASGADIYITGDVKYHAFLDYAHDIIVADIGHFESEEVILDTFYDIVTKKITTFAVAKADNISNPINYYTTL